MKVAPENPIGVFDSGLGGLTVVKEIINLLSRENIVYFGDTARVPYGIKSEETIREYSKQNARFLLSFNVKMIVIACNTSSAVSIEEVKKLSNVPVIGVIKPGAISAVRATTNKRIAVVGTNATVLSGAYEKEIKSIDSQIEVVSKACPLFVPIVEEGWADHKIALLTAQEYLGKLSSYSIDTLVLGCTHYPLLKNTIQKVVGENVKLIDSGVETAKLVKEILTQNDLLNHSTQNPNYQFYVSDLPHRFKEIGELFLGRKIEFLKKVDIKDW